MAGSRRHKPEHPRADEDDLAVFQLAREEELRLLELQRAQLDNIRTRTAQYLAFVGSASAFLAGSGLKAVNRDLWFYIVAGTATGLSALTIAFAYALFSNYNLAKLFTSKRRLLFRWGHTTDGHALAYAMSRVPPWSAADVAKKLAERYQEARTENAPRLKVFQVTHKWFLAFGSLQLLAWTIVVWTRGG